MNAINLRLYRSALVAKTGNEVCYLCSECVDFGQRHRLRRTVVDLIVQDVAPTVDLAAFTYHLKLPTSYWWLVGPACHNIADGSVRKTYQHLRRVFTIHRPETMRTQHRCYFDRCTVSQIEQQIRRVVPCVDQLATAHRLLLTAPANITLSQGIAEGV